VDGDLGWVAAADRGCVVRTVGWGLGGWRWSAESYRGMRWRSWGNGGVGGNW
jgi:hypothetical protein